MPLDPFGSPCSTMFDLWHSFCICSKIHSGIGFDKARDIYLDFDSDIFCGKKSDTLMTYS